MPTNISKVSRIHTAKKIIDGENTRACANNFFLYPKLIYADPSLCKCCFGIDAVPITIEVHIDAGIGYHLVGLPDNAVKESNYRIAAALTNTNYKLPGKRITINLAPADLRKGGLPMTCRLPLG